MGVAAPLSVLRPDAWKILSGSELSIRVSPSHSYNAGRAGLRWGGGRHRENVYAVCRGYVVVFAPTFTKSILGDGICCPQAMAVC